MATRTAAPLTLPRIARLFALCRKPATASRAAERVYNLRNNAFSWDEHEALLALSEALNEHRHVVLATFRGDIKATAEHCWNRRVAALRAVKASERAAA